MPYDRTAEIRSLTGELSELLGKIQHDEREIRLLQERMRANIATFRDKMSARDALEKNAVAG